MCLRCEDPKPLSEQARKQAEIYKAVTWGLMAGRGYGKNYATASKVRGEALHCKFIGGKHIVGYLKDEEPTKLPQKICGYRKPKVYWFGEAGNNFPYSLGNRSSHWAVLSGGLHPIIFDDYFKNLGDTVEEYNPLKGRRFIGISEVAESEQTDNDFLKRFTGDDWVETRTLDASSKSWVPQGKLFVSSGKPLKINEKSKETIEQVERIEYP